MDLFTDVCVSDFYCDIDHNSKVVIDAVAGALYEWTFSETIVAHHIHIDKEYESHRF